MIIAFIGIGGSGKTSNALAIYNKMREKKINVEFHPEFQYFVIRPLFLLLGRTGKITIRNTFLDRTKEIQSKPLLFKLWPYLIWLDYLCLYFYMKILKRHVVSVFDRYIYDFLPDWESLGYSSRMVRGIYLKFPKPDLVFYVDSNPELSAKRNYGEDLDLIKVMVSTYRFHLGRYSELIKILDIPRLKDKASFEAILDQVNQPNAKSSKG